MALYPHPSRRKRVETAATAALLYLTVAALFAGVLYMQGPRWGGDWTGIAEFAGFGIAGFIGLIAYVRGKRVR